MIAKLPIPNAEALNHSQQLVEHILSKIRTNHGSISFADFMDLALYTPNLGYYRSGLQKFGPTGDFITAPELSPIFSRCLARQCQQILQIINGGDILEVGAGSGQMAADLLIALARLNTLPQRYYILELSSDLQQRQQETIASLCPTILPRIHWLTSLPAPGFRGIVIGNEVLDAMPIHRFQIAEKGILETRVIEKVQGNGFDWQYFPSDNAELLEFYHANTQSTQPWPPGYTSEINLNLKPWIMSLADILNEGIILLIDYGFPRNEYYHLDRSMGTLMCHYRHYAHADPFFYPGLQDITAHVDFTAVAEAALEANLEILGFTNQAAFLLGCGLIDTLNASHIHMQTEKDNIKQNHAINLLTSPAEMGELFKVIALGKKFDGSLIGFSLGDKRYRL